jgi:hypothetical protein
MSRQHFLRLEGLTTADRLGMLTQVSEAINQSGAWITDFHQYSNLLICINFQVPNTSLGKLAVTLSATGLHLSQKSLEQLMPIADMTPPESELIGTLQITFIHNEPDLLREIPAVPG